VHEPSHKGGAPNALTQYRPVLLSLLRLCKEMRRDLRQYPRKDVPKDFILAFLTKAIQTLEAILLLQKNTLFHEAQVLIRVAFELCVTFDAFARLLGRNPRDACMRVLDCINLEKLKQQRASDFKGHDLAAGAPSPKEWEDIEREIASRHSEAELGAMRKYGFSGRSAEGRARDAGLADVYNVVYRNFSRNVHSVDLSELLMLNDPSLLRYHRADYFESRNGVTCDVASISAIEIAARVNVIFQLGFDRRLQRHMARRERVRIRLGFASV
jgi:hypothetical protein